MRNFLNTEEAQLIGAADRIQQWRDRAAETVDRMDRKVDIVGQFEELLEMRPDAVVVASNGRQQADSGRDSERRSETRVRCPGL